MQYRHFLRTAPVNPEDKSREVRESKAIVPGQDVADGNDHEPITTGPDADAHPNHDGNPTSTNTSITAHSHSPSTPSQYTYVSFHSSHEGDKSDKSNPQNWSMMYKAWVIAQISFLALSLTFASSVSSAASSGARMELSGGSELAGTATTGAFVVGIGFGAMPFAPLSECESSFWSDGTVLGVTYLDRVCELLTNPKDKQ